MSEKYLKDNPTASVQGIMSLLGPDNYNLTNIQSYTDAEKLNSCTGALKLAGNIQNTDRQKTPINLLQNLTNFSKTPNLLVPGYSFNPTKKTKR